MRATVVAGIGGLIIGHVLWLVAISLATKTTTVNAWVLVIGAACGLLGVAGGLLGWMFHRRKAFARAAFLWCLPISPVVLSLCVLGVTWL
ncbi:MAG: hypothetical protein ABW137_24510 [Mycobacterium sp.]